MITEYNDYVDVLQSIYDERRLVNTSYSLRAFARDMGIEPGNLSKIFSAKKGLSEDKALDLCERLGFTDDESNYFCDLVNVKHARSRKKRELAKSRLESYVLTNNIHQIKDDIFKVIADWYHFAILELITLEDFKSDTKWLAKRLGITELQVEKAIERLLNLELIRLEGKKIISTGVQLETTNGISSKSIKKLNSQLVKKAESSIINQNVNERHLSTLTVAINKNDLKEYGDLMEKFKREFDRFSIDSNKKNKPDEVYALTMQFFKLTN